MKHFVNVRIVYLSPGLALDLGMIIFLLLLIVFLLVAIVAKMK